MNDDKQRRALEVAQSGLDESVEKMPDELSAALAAARQRAIASAESAENDQKIVKLKTSFVRKQVVWGGAIAASCAALALTLVLRQPGIEPDDFLVLDGEGSLVLEAEGSLMLEVEDSMLALAEMDATEWELVQELEFALWLSEFGDEASAADFSG